VTFIAWSVAYGRNAQTFSRAGSVPKTVRNMIASTFNALGQVPFVGWVLALMVLVGLLLGCREAVRERNASRIAAPIALAIGSLLFASLIAVVRFNLNNALEASRYLHILAAMLLPACAVAADRIARQWKVLAPVVIATFLVGIPGNVNSVDKHIFPSQFYANQRRIITSLPRMPIARSVPRDLHPTPSIAAEVTVGWLLDGANSGRIPRSGPLSRLETANNTLRLSLQQLDAQPPGSRCTPLASPVLRRLSNGESVSISGTVAVQLLDPTGVPISAQLPFGSSILSTVPYHTLRAVGAPLNLRLGPEAAHPALC
jgi:hypothetical protein